MEIVNRTPFLAERAVLSDAEGRHLLVVMTKRTWVVGVRGLQIAEEQAGFQFADTFHGDPKTASPRLECDVVPYKRSTDVVVLGSAFAPRGRATEVDVTISVGTHNRTLRVFGDRHWSGGLGVPSISSPAHFEQIPLIYERAFGGIDASSSEPEEHEREARNPVGRGFVAKRTRSPLDGRLLPNIEDPTALIKRPEDRPEPQGFGFISRSWNPRASFAGTYDEAWALKRSPLLPEDFDDRFYSGAHPRLVSPAHLTGREPIVLLNGTPDGALRCQLPGILPHARVLGKDTDEEIQMVLDTLLVDADALRIIEVWRAKKTLLDDELVRVHRVEVTQ